MNHSALVSIIIPAFNRGELLRETLASISVQTYRNFECLVIDDGSEAETLEIARSFATSDSRFLIFQRPAHLPKGANSCRNFGFEKSQGKFVNWFDSDDIMLPTFIETKMEALSPGLDLIICTGHYVDENLGFIRNIPMEAKHDLFTDYVLWNAQVMTPSVLFRKDFLMNTELFSPKISRGQETELFCRIFFNLSASRYRILTEHLFLYRQHPDTKTSRFRQYKKAYKESVLYILDLNLERCLISRNALLLPLLYKNLVVLYFEALQNRDTETARKASKLVLKVLAKGNKRNYFEFKMLNLLFLSIGRGSYRLQKRVGRYAVNYV
ncbi:glycosyltransferase family 2 protein [Flavobacterium selenitireducens]|uniref:glycosyltransferase family 2 protein n=1 Tax=Flavobacterium selenitireducens TaxID=2722704 RepID=UPI00168B18EE|nr:glycosyltransferase family 2 protein [Flavobacterium selenitireducens]MBD3583441.1 glycosyltransferase family 2 protein [Flavobacterium selenitireducens]